MAKITSIRSIYFLVVVSTLYVKFIQGLILLNQRMNFNGNRNQILRISLYTHQKKLGHTYKLSFAKVSTVSEVESVEEDFYIDEQELVNRINKEVYEMDGVELEDLINPSKVVSLEREILQLNNKLTKTAKSDEIRSINEKLEKAQSKLNIEKRAVMRGWLKNLFLGQSILAGFISLAMVYDVVPGYSLPLSIKVLGFWMWWLFIIPSLRARKPVVQEKEALNLAFLFSPLASVAMPFLTKDVVIIWWVNAAVIALCYAYAFLIPKTEGSGVFGNDTEEENNVPPLLMKALKALDYGSGRERGVRK